MSESYFAKLANEILDASEKIVDRFEEGMNILLGEGGSGNKASATTDGGSSSGGHTPPESIEDEFEGWDGAEDDMEDPSPLAGIAQSVMEDIMAGQVSVCSYHRGQQQ
jgi:hypothetical protein